MCRQKEVELRKREGKYRLMGTGLVFTIKC